MDLMLISSAGLWTGALAATSAPRGGIIVTALIRAATGAPAGLAAEIGAAGSSVGEGAPTSRRSRRDVGVGRRGDLHRRVASAPGHRLQPGLPSVWPSARSPPACRGTRIGDREGAVRNVRS